jgi:DNA-binding NarL/FixJ family response regulator
MRLLIIAEIRLYREGLAQVLGGEAGLQVLGTASDGEEGVWASSELQPDLALCGAGATIDPSIVGCIQEVSPGTRILVIGVSGQESAIIAWVEAGVAGYITEEQSLAELKQAIDDLCRGAARCSPPVSAALMRRIAALAKESSTAREYPALTRRETQILHLIRRGLSNKEIATELSIEVATVKNHVHNILGKLGVRGRAEAVATLHHWPPLGATAYAEPVRGGATRKRPMHGGAALSA